MSLTLYDFQQEDVDKYAPVRSILNGSDMGTGKTVTTVVMDSVRRKSWDKRIPPKTLIICPVAVIDSWRSHYQQWAPQLRVYEIDTRDHLAFRIAVESGMYDVYIVNFAGMRMAENLATHAWFHVIIDEAHGLQDHTSAQSRAAQKIPAYYKTALSGTPSWHRPEDLFGILHWLYPNHWASLDSYNKMYCKGKRSIKNQEILQHEISGFYICHKKEDVLKHLPKKIYAEIPVELGEKQRRAYDTMASQFIAHIGEHEDEVISVPNALVQIGRLQQFAIAYGKLEDDKMLLDEPSAKLDKVMELVHKANGPLVVFSQFEQVIRLFEQRLKAQHIPHGVYTGSIPKHRRDDVVRDFQANKLKVFAGTLKAGGQGLTLTAASRMIRIDREWVEALNEQAVNRIHRVGQTQTCQIADLVANNTVDRWRIARMEISWKVLKRLLGEDKNSR